MKKKLKEFIIFSLSLLQSFFSFSTSSFSGTQHEITQPPAKSSSLSLRTMLVFQAVEPWRTTFTLFCIIPLWDAATAHSPSGKELIFLRLLFGNLLTLFCLVSYLASFVCYSPILLIKSICAFILYVVYTYSERPSLSKILYFIFGSFSRERPPHPKYFILCVFYVNGERPPLWRKVQPRLWQSQQNKASFFLFLFFFGQNIRKQYYCLPQQSP